MAVVGTDPVMALSPASGGADALAAIKQLVLDSVSSPLTRVMYARALEDLFGWWNGQGRPAFTRATVQAWRAALEAKGLAPASVNQKLSAVRKLPAEAAYNGLLDPAAQAIRDIRGTRRDDEPGETGSRHPDGAGRLRTAARRSRPVDLRPRPAARRPLVRGGPGRQKGRFRTVPIPAWTKMAIDSWAAAAGITAGPVFRGVNKGDVVIGDRLSTQGILRAVTRYADAIAPHDLRRTFAKLAFKGGAKLDQIQLSLGHASIQTTERYLGVQQDLTVAPCDYLHLKVD
jgi:integrase